MNENHNYKGLSRPFLLLNNNYNKTQTVYI